MLSERFWVQQPTIGIPFGALCLINQLIRETHLRNLALEEQPKIGLNTTNIV
jgi:hypothetical protein